MAKIGSIAFIEGVAELWHPTELTVVDLHEMGQLEAAARLLWRVWGASTPEARAEVMSVSVLAGLALAGNYVAGAYRGDEIIGCAVGFYGADGDRPGHVHSHITGVDRSRQNKGVGFLLKKHQREWALKRGFVTIRWTFDPLVRRNAYFNLCKLGAEVYGYANDLYGELDDGTNDGDSTDRLLLEWRLTSSRVNRAVDGGLTQTVDHLRGAKHAEEIFIPEGAAQLRERDPQRMRELRESVRGRFGRLMADGYRVVGMTTDGCYVLLPHEVAMSVGPFPSEPGDDGAVSPHSASGGRQGEAEMGPVER